MPEIENEHTTKLKKRRPERQLYVPPAQRKSSIKDNVVKKNITKEKNSVDNEEKKETAGNNLTNISVDNEGESTKCIKDECFLSVVNKFSTLLDCFMCSYFFKARCECEIFENHILKFKPASKLQLCLKFRDILGAKFTKLVNCFISEISIIQFYSSPLVLDSLENIFLWKTALKEENHISSINENFFPLHSIRKYFWYSSDILEMRMPSYRNFDELCSTISDKYMIFCEYDGYFIKNDFLVEKHFQHIYRHYFLWENLLKEQQERDDLYNFCEQTKPMMEIIPQNNSLMNQNSENNIFQQEQNNIPLDNSVRNNEQESRIKDISKDLSQNPALSKKDRKSKRGGHEEELEIMRRTKENINRKIRPIIKYIPNINDTLNIDDIKDWEELFDDDGEIKKEYLARNNKEQKSISNITGNYDEEIKQIEELEHMVELYDFPSSFKTNDLIQAFNNIDSEAMYIKWVDDTHAILVLGSLTQAMKAIDLDNPLIKVRPMSLASKSTLSTAYKNDLKPAMKRPPTNLQTARRFITAHLGTKIGVSKEKMTKERDDLRAAREMKRKARQNEKDAWEGNLKSTIH